MSKLEIERKRMITNDTAAVMNNITSAGLKLVGELHETDTYYSRPDVDFMKTVECLRVRDRDEFAEITYKPPTNADTRTTDGVIMKTETNLEIAKKSTVTARELLENLGMVKLVDVVKHRKMFRSKADPEITVTVDIVAGAGVFIETEVISSDKERGLAKLDELEKRLGINNLPLETRHYRDICLG